MRRIVNKAMALKLAALVGALLAFASCVSMEMESQFNEDGSAIHTMALTIDMGDLGQLGDLGEGELDPFENFDDIEQEAAQEGFRVERIEDGDIVGVRLTKEVDDTEDLGEILNSMFNAGAADGSSVAPFSGTFEQDGNEYKLNLTVDGAQLTDTAGEGLGEGGDLGEFGLDLSTIFDFTYSARMPGEIDVDETNGRISEDGLITWDLPLEGSETLTAVSAEEDSSNWVWILVVLGIIALGLIAIAGIVFVLLMTRRKPATEPAVVSETVSPPATPTSYAVPDQPTTQITPVTPVEPEAGAPDENGGDDQDGGPGTS